MAIKRCPQCGDFNLTKARLDVYWCWECERAWLIHKLSYKSLDEASKTDVDKMLRHASFTMPILPIEFPPMTKEDIEALVVHYETRTVVRLGS